MILIVPHKNNNLGYLLPRVMNASYYQEFIIGTLATIYSAYTVLFTVPVVLSYSTTVIATTGDMKFTMSDFSYCSSCMFMQHYTYKINKNLSTVAFYYITVCLGGIRSRRLMYLVAKD